MAGTIFFVMTLIVFAAPVLALSSGGRGREPERPVTVIIREPVARPPSRAEAEARRQAGIAAAAAWQASHGKRGRRS